MDWRLIATFSLCWIAIDAQDCKIDVLFILDSSSSVKDDFEKEIKFIQDISDMLIIEPDKHRVAIVEYAGHTKKVLRFDWEEFPTLEAFTDRLQKLPHMAGTTYTARALKVAVDVLKKRRSGVQTLVISVTDGYSWDVTEPVMEQIRALDPEQITTFAAAINVPLNEQELLIMAGDESRIFREPDPLAQARKVLEPYLRCEKATDAPTTQPPTRPPPETTPAPTPPPDEKTCLLDLAIFLDSSGRTSDLFERYRDLAAQLVNSMDVSPGATRVALVSFAETVTPVFHMNTHSDKDSVVQAINNAVFTPGYRSIGAALSLGVQEFDPENGARNPGQAKQAAVVLSNGFSCDDPSQFAQELRDKGVVVYVLSLGGNVAVDSAEVQSVAGDASRLFTDDTFSVFLKQFQTESCDEFAQKKTSTAFQPSPPPYRRLR